MTETRKTWYSIEYHVYAEITPCEDPKNCGIEGHWSESDDEYDTIREVRDASNTYDTPAVRFVKSEARIKRTRVA